MTTGSPIKIRAQVMVYLLLAVAIAPNGYGESSAARNGIATAPDLPAALNALKTASGQTPEPELANLLEDVRAAADPKSAAVLVRLLPHQSQAYRDRDQLQVVFLRAYVLVILSEVGVPKEALPYLLDSVAHIDERVVPVEVGAAARAIGSLGPRGRGFAPYLLATLDKLFAVEEFTLDHHGTRFLPGEATTVQLEAAAALSKICSRRDRDVIEHLESLTLGDSDQDPRLSMAAAAALQAIRSRGR